ncbi:flagellar hook-length control protein FliK [Mesorhizobium sp. VK25A]|uniref:Flagellar hook-length control protein FliK n=1 Tax=Mesorhizobium vachelliae TaxID=3072309 RepID=A0ABU5A157_9HYPH|nr:MULTISPECIES: flagellar hook-length control protein FliK [unclassified Mesorhizobium]MDX8530397.1 flagellar hook-length control protein FliK [Mesorhizobium sp. VK25D]MDX8542374.1 flagellar hook-length control protein FliK [Mesorhizobium sp. VK25A]
MTSVSQTVPGFASTQSQPRQHATGGKDKDQNFGEMVHGTEKPDRPQDKHATGPVLPDAHTARRASANSGNQEPDRAPQDKTGSQKAAAGKSTKTQTDQAKPAADKDSAAQTDDSAPLQDRLPLLMALSDMKHFAQSSGTGGKSSADGEDGAGEHGSLELPLRPGKRAAVDNSAGPQSRSTHSTAAEDHGPDFGQKPVKADMAIGMPGRGDAKMVPAHGNEPQADKPVPPRGWRPSSASKASQQTQSATQQTPAKPSSSTTRMEVVSQQSFPAPAQNPIGQTASALVEALASDNGVQQAFASASAGSQTTNSVAVPTHVLKIELHPSELGSVTASLRLSGEQLSIEMKPETHEAYRRLTADSDAIVKSMRSLGFDVDKVTILQPSIAAHAAGRADATNAMPMSMGRDQPSFQPGNSGGNGAGGDRQPGRNDGHGAQEFSRAVSPLRERAGDDMYI